LVCFLASNPGVLVRVPDAEKTIKSVGRRIAELREAAGLTQDQLAELIEMEPANLRPIEGGRRNMTIRTMCRIATALGCSVPDLFAPPTSHARRGPGRPRTR
jgi:transcriptional regulator with XRE-family HTH domain